MAADFPKHMDHRFNVLRGFKARRKDVTVPEKCAMKDGAMITCRVLWEIMGVKFDSRDEETPATPQIKTNTLRTFNEFKKLPAGISVKRILEMDFDALKHSNDVSLVLVAANKCVAHIDQYPDHGVSDEMLDRVIDITFAEFSARVT